MVDKLASSGFSPVLVRKRTNMRVSKVQTGKTEHQPRTRVRVVMVMMLCIIDTHSYSYASERICWVPRLRRATWDRCRLYTLVKEQLSFMLEPRATRNQGPGHDRIPALKPTGMSARPEGGGICPDNIDT